MTLQNFPGSKRSYIGLNPGITASGPVATNSITSDAANEAAIFIGHIETSDGGSHTIDTTGSSSIGWRTGSVTFASGSTTFKVGIAPVDTGNGPPGRASNAADVISFDVSASFTGGGGGVTANAWQTSVPTAGTKTIANGDLVAICMQMTARGGADSINITYGHSNCGAVFNRPALTSFTGAAYAATLGMPIALITFSDGALGWIYGADVASAMTAQTWNSSSGTKEYGQLFNLPFPYKVHGLYGWVFPSSNAADLDFILYSDPLGGSPVAEKTVSIDANTIASVATARRTEVMFAAPYSVAANTNIGAVYKPGATNVSAYYKTLNAAGHRVSDPWGTSGYGISRASGAFANANSSLDHYYIGLIVSAFDDGAGGSGPAGKLISVARGSPY